MLKWIFVLDIEAQIREIQSRKKEVTNEENGASGVGLGESGYFDRDIYGGSGKFDGYVTSIAANDEVEVSLMQSYHVILLLSLICINK